MVVSQLISMILSIIQVNCHSFIKMEEQKKKYLLSRIKKEQLIIETQYKQFKHVYHGQNILQERVQPYLALISHLVQLNNTFAVQLIQFLEPFQVKSIFERFNSVFTDVFDKYKKVQFDLRLQSQQKANGDNKKLCQICHEDMDNRRLMSIRQNIDREAQSRAVLIKNLIEETEKERVKPLFTFDEERMFKAELDKVLLQKEVFMAKKIKETGLFLEKVTSEMSRLMIDFRDQFADRHEEPIEDGVNWTKMMKHFVNKKLATSFQGKIPDWIKKMFEMFLQSQPVKPKVYYCNKSIQTDKFVASSEVTAKFQLEQSKKRYFQKNRECEVFKAEIEIHKQECRELKNKIKQLSEQLSDKEKQNSKLAKEKEELLIRETLNKNMRPDYKQLTSKQSQDVSIAPNLRSKKTLIGSEIGSNYRLATNTNIQVDKDNRSSEHSEIQKEKARQSIGIQDNEKSHKSIAGTSEGKTNFVERTSIKAETKKLKKIVYNRLNREDQLSRSQAHKKASSDVREEKQKLAEVWQKDKGLKQVKQDMKQIADKLKSKQELYRQQTNKPIIKRANSRESIQTLKEKKANNEKGVSIALNSQITQIKEEVRGQAYQSSQTSQKNLVEKIQIGTQTPSFNGPLEKSIRSSETLASSKQNSFHQAVMSSIQKDPLGSIQKEPLGPVQEEHLGSLKGYLNSYSPVANPQNMAQCTPEEVKLLDKMIKAKKHQSPMNNIQEARNLTDSDSMSSIISKSLQKSDYMTGCVVPLQRKNKSLFALDSPDNKQNHSFGLLLPKVNPIKREPMNNELKQQSKMIRNKKTSNRTTRPQPKPSKILSGVGEHLFMLFMNDDFAERYEQSFNEMSNRKETLRPTPSQLTFLKQMFAMLQVIQKNKPNLYVQVCAFLRFPYSESKNHFLARDIVKDLNFETFVNFFLKIMFIHRGCQISGQGCFCEHIKEFDLKLTMMSQGKQLIKV